MVNNFKSSTNKRSFNVGIKLLITFFMFSLLKKGSKIYIEGQLQTRKFTDNNGVEKYTPEVVLANYNGTLTMLDSRGGSSDFGSESSPQIDQDMSQDSNFSSSDDLDIDDEIPF